MARTAHRQGVRDDAPVCCVLSAFLSPAGVLRAFLSDMSACRSAATDVAGSAPGNLDDGPTGACTGFLLPCLGVCGRSTKPGGAAAGTQPSRLVPWQEGSNKLKSWVKVVIVLTLTTGATAGAGNSLPHPQPSTSCVQQLQAASQPL